jgi:hypothetical protein
MADKNEDLKIMRQILNLQDRKLSELKFLWEKMFDHPPAISSREYMIAKIATAFRNWPTAESTKPLKIRSKLLHGK